MQDRPTDPLTRNLLDVFNERDGAKRMAVVQDLYTEDAVFFEPDASFAGYEQINGRVTAFLATVPADFLFRAVGSPTQNHDAARLAWTLGPEGGPVVAAGMDVGILRDGKIAALYLFFDPA